MIRSSEIYRFQLERDIIYIFVSVQHVIIIIFSS